MNALASSLKVVVLEEDPKPLPAEKQMRILLVGPSDDDMRELFKRGIKGKPPGAIKRQTRRQERRREKK